MAILFRNFYIHRWRNFEVCTIPRAPKRTLALRGNLGSGGFKKDKGLLFGLFKDIGKLVVLPLNCSVSTLNRASEDLVSLPEVANGKDGPWIKARKGNTFIW